jgi:hypothetical protein
VVAAVLVSRTHSFSYSSSSSSSKKALGVEAVIVREPQ